MENQTDASENKQTNADNDGQDAKIVMLPVATRSSSKTPMPASPERMAELLQNSGYKGRVVENEYKRFVESSAEGWAFSIYFYSEGSQPRENAFTSFMLTSGWRLQKDDALNISSVANIFNRKSRFQKALVVTGDDYAYTETEMDQYCPDGISDEQFVSFLEIFINLRQSYLALCREQIN